MAHAKEMFAVLSDFAIYEFENAPPESEASLALHYAKLESRRSPDGSELWLNWVIRLPGGNVAGYIQAAILDNGLSLIAYELGSCYWRKGIGSAALAAVLIVLESHYSVRFHAAILKACNFRSFGLLHKLGFEVASEELASRFQYESDEIVMGKSSGYANTL
jgi:RimJ/RimL family protein N-acetyltransferase